MSHSESCTVELGFAYVDGILKCDHSIQAFEQYFPVVLITLQYFSKHNLGVLYGFDLLDLKLNQVVN